MCFDSYERHTLPASVCALLLALIRLTVPSVSHAQFDWGSECTAGSGSFAVTVPAREALVLRTLPSGKSNALVELTSARDLDIVLVDVVTDTEIVASPADLLNQDVEACATYAGVG
ncbi:MAG: hypothetical protein ACJAYU_000883 [Bradymonadia bacterium]|jgi:hypothetical protein